MEEFQSVLTFFETHRLAAYFIVFLWLCFVFEGETPLIVSGVLIQLGALKASFIAPAAILGAFLGSILWYSLGGFFSKEGRGPFFKRLINFAHDVVDRLLPHFRSRPAFSLTLAKFIYGTNHASMILAGSIQMPILSFLKIQILASSLWISVFMGLGFFFGYAALQVSQHFGIFLLVVLFLIVGLIAIQRALSFYYESKENKL